MGVIIEYGKKMPNLYSYEESGDPSRSAYLLVVVEESDRSVRSRVVRPMEHPHESIISSSFSTTMTEHASIYGLE